MEEIWEFKPLKKITIGSKMWMNLILSGARTLGINMDSDQARLLTRHCELLIQWNKKINLTAITDPYEVAIKHVLDAIAPTNYIQNDVALLDMGSGGGFPGIPLKIVNPSLSVTLVDAVEKKVSFLKHVVRTLKIKDCTAISGRVEALAGHPEYTEKYQVVVSRSFAPLGKIIKWASPFLAAEGQVIALKGKNVAEELPALEAEKGLDLNKYQIKIDYYDIPQTDLKRALVFIRRS